MNIKETFCTIDEASEILGTHRNTVTRWIKEGELGVQRIGESRRGIVLIERRLIEEILRNAPRQIRGKQRHYDLSKLKL